MSATDNDEHVVFYGRPRRHTPAGPIQLQSWTGCYNAPAHHLEIEDDMENLTPAGSLPYPRLLIRHLNDVLSKHDVWQIESMQISHVQLLGTSEEFRTFASFVQKFQTLQTVLFSDAITSQQQPCGFDAILMALSNCSQLKEVSLQNMSSISPSAIGQLCAPTIWSNSKYCYRLPLLSMVLQELWSHHWSNTYQCRHLACKSFESLVCWIQTLAMCWVTCS